MSWRPQQPEPPPPPPRESPHAVAWAALFFSLVACALAGFSFLSSYKGGEYGERLKEGVAVFQGEARKWIDRGEVKLSEKSAEAKTGSGESAGAGDAEAGKSEAAAAIPWDRIREKVSEARDLIATGDDEARRYLDELNEEISRLRRAAGEAKDGALDSAAKAVEDARRTFDDGTSRTADKLKELQLDLAPKVRAMLDRAEEAKPDSASPKP